MNSQKKYRVLFVVRFLWGDEGISIGLIRLSRGLQNLGWDVALASAMGSDLEKDQQVTHGPDWFEENGLRHFCVPFPRLKAKTANLKQSAFALSKLCDVIDEYNPDVINIHSLSMLPFVQIVRIKYGIPIVSTARVMPSNTGNAFKVIASLNKYFGSFLLGQRFIAISSEVKEFYIKNLNLPDKIVRLVCHGIDRSQFHPPLAEEKANARTELGIDSGQDIRVISTIARLDPVKDHETLFRAIQILKKEGLKFVVICAGKGGLFESSIKSLPAKYGVDDCVSFCGFVDSRKVLWASDIFVLPSRREGFPWVVIEAMMSRVVPVRTQTSGASDQIVDGDTGYTFPVGNYDLLAKHLRKLLQNDSLRSLMASSAMNSAISQFTLEIMSMKTSDVYKELIDR